MLIYALCLKLVPESIWSAGQSFFLPCFGWLAFLPHFRSPFFVPCLNDVVVVVVWAIKRKALTDVGGYFFFDAAFSKLSCQRVVKWK